MSKVTVLIINNDFFFYSSSPGSSNIKKKKKNMQENMQAADERVSLLVYPNWWTLRQSGAAMGEWETKENLKNQF